MEPDLETRIRAIPRMTTAELKAEWVRLNGAPPRSGNVQWMRKRLVHRAQVDVLGDLSPEAKARLEYLMQFAPQWVPMGRRSLANRVVAPPKPEPTPRPNGKGKPTPGTVLSRFYKGRTVEVLVRETGWEYEGTIYASLTAAAQAITGSHWNGNLFFGLTQRETTA